MFTHQSLSQLRSFFAKDPYNTSKLSGLIKYPQYIESLLVKLSTTDGPGAAAIQAYGQYHMYGIDEAASKGLIKDIFQKHPEEPVFFAGFPRSLLPYLQENAEVLWNEPCRLYYLPDALPLEHLLQAREGGEALQQGEWSPPTVDDIPLILEHWPFGDVDNPKDHIKIKKCLEGGLASGWRESGHLKSWIFCHMDGSMGFMHTLESVRNRGLAQKVTADLAWKVRKSGARPYLFVVESNPGPLGLLKRLGFVASHERFVWLEAQGF